MTSTSPIAWDTLPLRRIPSQGRSRDKVAHAIAVAEEIALRDGADAITLPRVANEAGISVGALYQYLPDRDAIVGVLMARYHERLEDLLDAAITEAATSPTPDDPIDAVIDAVADVYSDEAGGRALQTAVTTPALAAARAAHKARMSARVAALLRAVDVHIDADIDVVARVAFAAADGVFHVAFDAAPAARAHMLDQLRVLLHGYLSTPHPTAHA